MAFVMVMTANVWGMQVYVHYANGTWPTDIADYHFNSSSGNLIIAIESSGSIGEVKDKIADKSGFEAANITLSFGTYADLDDSYTLAYYNITSESTINMTYADPTQPQRVTDNNWRVQTMPRGDRVLRTIWKQDSQLAWKVGEEAVTVESNPLVAYLGFPFTGATLSVVDDDILGEVTYSIAHKTGTNSGNTIDEDGVVTINGVGIDTVKAIFAGNDDYLPDTAMYIIDSRAPYTLTLVAIGNGTLLFDTPSNDPPEGVLSANPATDEQGNPRYIVHPSFAGNIELVVAPASQNYLVSWTNVSLSDVDPYRAVVDFESSTNVTVTATFAPNPTLTVVTTGSGSVSVASVIGEVETPQTADANTTNVYTLDPGTEVKLTATAATNYHFVSWEDNSTAAIRTLTMPSDGTENVEVTATFVGDAYLTIASNNTEYGNVAFVMASSEQKAHEKAVASTDYVPTPTGVDLYENCNNDNTKWYYDNDGIDASLGYMIYKSNGPEVSRVVFTLTNNETYTVTASTGSNTNAYFYYVYPKYNNVYSDANYTNLVCSSCGITKVELYVGNPSNPEGVEFVDATHAYVKPGKSVDVKATPNAAYYFVKWNDEEAINSNVAVTTSYTAPANGTYEAASLTANFAINTYTITATANDNNMGTVSGGGTYNEAATVTLTATPATGYHFVNWTKTGETSPVSTAATYSFNATAETEGSYIANFAVNTYTLTLATDPTNGLQGTLDVVRNNNNELPAGVTGTYPNYTVNEGVYVPLVILPVTHYHLVSLIGGTNQPINYSDNHATIAVNKDSTITATFAIDTYVITATANNSTLGTVSGGGTYNHGVTVTLTATATDSTHFVNWTKEGETNPVSTTATYNFTAEAAGNYTANFAINPTLKLVADGNGTVNTVGAIAGVTPKNAAAKEYYVAPDTVVTVEATPDNAYYFVNWNSAAARNSNVAVDTVFTMGTDNVILTGHFAKKPVITLVADGHGKVVVDSINNELPAGVVYNNDYNANTGTRSYVVNYGMTLDIVATPDQGYRLLEWENHTSDSVRTVGSIVCDTTFTAYFALPTPGLTPEGKLTTLGGEFVSETGEIVGRPRITETGEIISNSSQLLSVVISSTYNGLDPVTIYYKSGDTWVQALDRPENAGCGIQIVGNQLKKGGYSVYQPVYNLVNPNSEIKADIEYHFGT